MDLYMYRDLWQRSWQDILAPKAESFRCVSSDSAHFSPNLQYDAIALVCLKCTRHDHLFPWIRKMDRNRELLSIWKKANQLENYRDCWAYSCKSPAFASFFSWFTHLHLLITTTCITAWNCHLNHARLFWLVRFNVCQHKIRQPFSVRS